MLGDACRNTTWKQDSGKIVEQWEEAWATNISCLGMESNLTKHFVYEIRLFYSLRKMKNISQHWDGLKLTTLQYNKSSTSYPNGVYNDLLGSERVLDKDYYQRSTSYFSTSWVGYTLSKSVWHARCRCCADIAKKAHSTSLTYNLLHLTTMRKNACNSIHTLIKSLKLTTLLCMYDIRLTKHAGKYCFKCACMSPRVSKCDIQQYWVHVAVHIWSV